MSEIKTKVTRFETDDEYHGDKTYPISSTLMNLGYESLPMLQRKLLGFDRQDDEPQHFTEGKHWHTIRYLGGIDVWRETRALVVPEEFTIAGGTKVSNGKAAKEWLDRCQRGRDVVTGKTLDRLAEMERRFRANKLAVMLDENAVERELSIRVDHPEYKFKMKNRPDLISGKLFGYQKPLVLCDYKTTREVDPVRGFKKSVRSYGYGRSAAFYIWLCRMAGFDVEDMHFLVTSTVSLETQVVRLNEDYLATSMDQVLSTLREISDVWHLLTEGDWHGPSYGCVHWINP